MKQLNIYKKELIENNKEVILPIFISQLINHSSSTTKQRLLYKIIKELDTKITEINKEKNEIVLGFTQKDNYGNPMKKEVNVDGKKQIVYDLGQDESNLITILNEKMNESLIIELDDKVYDCLLESLRECNGFINERNIRIYDQLCEEMGIIIE